MKPETFKIGYAALINAFANSEKTTPATMDVYWEMLRRMPDEKFETGVRKCLATCKFFPTIAELGAACLPPLLERLPYNPHVYREPRKLNWTEQLDEMEQDQRRLLADKSSRKPLFGFWKKDKN